jgi:hypothetical protein
MKISPLMFCALLGMTALSVPALADDMSKAPDMAKPSSCFSMRDFESWKSPDARTIYIRVGMDRFYRLDLSAPCQELQMINSHLITKTRGSDQVCSGLDWDLAVSDSTGALGHDGFKEACIVKTQTPLSPAEVAQIPKKFRP